MWWGVWPYGVDNCNVGYLGEMDSNWSAVLDRMELERSVIHEMLAIVRARLDMR